MTFTPQNQYSKKDLIACGDGELFGIGNGRLPSDQMLMFDEIESIFDSGGNGLGSHDISVYGLRIPS